MVKQPPKHPSKRGRKKTTPCLVRQRMDHCTDRQRPNFLTLLLLFYTDRSFDTSCRVVDLLAMFRWCVVTAEVEVISDQFQKCTGRKLEHLSVNRASTCETSKEAGDSC